MVKNALEKSKDINIDDLFGEYIKTDLLYLSSLYYNLILYHTDKCQEIISEMNVNQLSVFAISLAKPECIKRLYENELLMKSLKEVCSAEVTNGNLSGVLVIALKKTLELELSHEEVNKVQEFFNNNKLLSVSIFWKDHCDTVGLLLHSFKEYGTWSKVELPIKKYVEAYSTFIKMYAESYSISKFVKSIKPNIYTKNEADYYIRILLGKALALANDEDFHLKGAIAYISTSPYDSGLLVIYHNMKLFNPSRFEKLLNATDLTKLYTAEIYQDIDFESTSDCLFMLSFILSRHNNPLSYEVLLKGISNGILRMNNRKDTIGDYKLLDSFQILLKNNWISSDALINYLMRILKIAEVMNLHHIENDTHGIVMKLLTEHNFEAAKFYYEKISTSQETYNSIHLDYAQAMIYRGINIRQIENCLKNISSDYDRYYEKLSWDGFYYKIMVYLNIANSDFYADHEKEGCFKKACNEIQSLVDAGWERELKKSEYELYTQLCKRYSKEVDVEEEREIEYTISTKKESEVKTLDILKKVEVRTELDELFKKLESKFLLDNFEVNDLLIEKCYEICGNIDLIFELLNKLHYPSNSQYSYNSMYFWMTVVSALRNQRSKNSMIDFLIKTGGGHDGFSELIKIYGFLDSKEICIRAFDTMLKSIEFLLC